MNEPKNCPEISVLDEYRKTELTLFYGQVISIFVYNILCKFYIFLKRLFTTKE